MSRYKSWNASVYIVTWNVSSKYPDSVQLHQLLGLGNNPDADLHRPDFFAIGLQEINAQPQSVVKGLFREDPWTLKFKELLKDRGYVAIKTEQMQGLLLLLFAKRTHLLHVRQVETEYTRTGLGGIWGNKGAVSIRFSLYGCSFCLVNAHLAAHDHMLEERINDYQKIVEEHKFHVKTTRDIFGHDYVFWFGDLNFRLASEAEPAEIRDLVKAERYTELISLDQLLQVRNQGRAFAELEERLPAFPPTFKFEHGTSEYDLKRRPAWTDRVLYKKPQNCFKNVTLMTEQTSYRSHPGYNLSDHKPVTSEFTVKVQIKVPPTRPMGRMITCVNDNQPRAAHKRHAVHIVGHDLDVLSNLTEHTGRPIVTAGTEKLDNRPETNVVKDDDDDDDKRPTSVELNKRRDDEEDDEYDDDDTDEFDDDSSSASDDNDEPNAGVVTPQVFEDPTEKIVEFSPVSVWQIGESNVVEYELPYGYEEAENDWIGIFRADFSSLDEYVAYEYTSRSKAPGGADVPADRVIYHLEFPETVDVPEDDRFVLLYFQSTGTRGVTGLVGISNVFRAEKRCPSPRFDTVD